MSTTVDSRAVSLDFDNAGFEKGVSKSLNTLNLLNSSLNKLGNGNLSGLGSAVVIVSDRFSALEEIAVGALRNIGAEISQTTIRLIKNLSVDQISAGFEKFGDKTTSVATLLAQGFDLETVTEQLDMLNWFTDETSYNFVDMVSNIGKFTASGKGLEESVTAMEGIANWAALSGQNATTASRAMYQISQAMSAGVMRKEDYKSIQNASMDTKEFREQCIQAGIALGYLTEQKKKDGTVTYKTTKQATKSGVEFGIDQFADNLTESGWLTSEVMMDVFTKYSEAVDALYTYTDEVGGTASDAMSLLQDLEAQAESTGKTVEEIIDQDYDGDQNLKDLYSGVSEFGIKAFKAAQQARTFGDVIDSIKDAASTSWMQTFDLIFGNNEEVIAFWTDLANSLYDVFMASAEVRNGVLELWASWGGREWLFGNDEDKRLGAFWKMWEAIGSILAPIKDAFNDVFNAGRSVESLTITLASKLVALTAKFQRFAENLELTEDESAKVRKVFVAVLSVVKKVFKSFGDLKLVLSPLGDILKQVITWIGEALSYFADNAVIDANKSFSVTKNILEKIGAALQKVANAMKKFDFIGFLKGASEGSEEAGENAEKTVSIFTRIWNVIKKVYSGITTVVEPLKKAMSALGDTLKKVWKKITDMKITDMIGTLVKGGLGLSLIKFVKKLIGVLGKGEKSSLSFKEFLGELSEHIEDFRETLAKGLNIGTLVALAGSMLMLAVAIGIFAVIAENADIYRTIELLAGSLMVVVFAAYAVSRCAKEMLIGGAAMFVLAGAMLVLAVAVGIFAAVASFADIENTILLLAGAVIVLAVAAIALNNATPNMIAGAAAVFIIASALVVLGVAIGVFALIVNYADIFNTITLLAGSLLVVVFAAYAVSTAGPKMLIGASAMLIMAGAMVVLAAAMAIFAVIAEYADIENTVLLFAGAVLVLYGVTVLLNSATPQMLLGASAMLVLAGALVVLGIAVGIFSLIANNSDIFNTITLLAGSLLIVVFAGYTLGTAAGVMISGAVALLTLSVALGILGLVIGKFADITVSADFCAVLELLAGALTIVGVAGTAFGTAAPLIEAGALALGSMDLALAGLDLVLLGAAEAFDKMGDAIANIGDGAVNLGNGIETFKNAAKGMEDIGWVSLALGVGKFSGEVKSMSKINFKFVDKVTSLGTAADSLSAVPEDLYNAFKNIPDAFTEMAESVKSISATQSSAMTGYGIAWASNLVSGMGSRTSWFISKGSLMGYYFGRGFYNGIKGCEEDVGSASYALGQTALAYLKQSLGIASPSKETAKFGAFFDEGYANGIKDNAKMVDKEAEKLGSGSLESMKEALSSVADVIESGIGTDPVIRPVIDLSDVENKAPRLKNLLGDGTRITATGSSAIAAAINGMRSPKETKTPDNSVIITINAKSLTRADVDYVISEANRRLGARV